MLRSAHPPADLDHLHGLAVAVAEAAPARNDERGLLPAVPYAHGVQPLSVSEAVHAVGLVESVTSGQERREAWDRLNRGRRLGRMRRGVHAAGDVLQALSTDARGYVVFFTGTYRPGVAWSPRHISEFLRCARRYLERRQVSFRYVWVLELTQRGVPHYHVAIWMPGGVMLPKPDDAGWWPHGSTRIERARKPVGYLAKYASKGSDVDELPRGARLWGCGGLERDGRAELRHAMLPRYVRNDCRVGDHVIRFKGVGGWVNLATGQWWPPPIARVVGGKVVFSERA